MREQQIYNIVSFIKEETVYFQSKAQNISYDDFLSNGIDVINAYLKSAEKYLKNTK
jgi:hypothetical protein